MTDWTNRTAKQSQTALPERSWKQAMLRGFSCRCPQCGEGRMFNRFLKVSPVCEQCQLALDGHRADDFPPYVTMMIVGHIVVPLNLVTERLYEWPLSWHLILWPLLAIILTLALIQPVKGALIGYQWALRLHGFDPNGDPHDLPVRP
jgi:uncharacterized protein (DUF983 family)